MKDKKYSVGFIAKIIAAVVMAFWMMTGSFPTGWIYDIGAGRGTEQGQMPDQSVQMLHSQKDAEDFYFKKIPATVSKENLIQCPLLHLRDERYKGLHKHKKNGGVRAVHISEYVHTAYPIDLYTKFYCNFFTSGPYNKYYLAPLEDGSYICVYFDDYLMMSLSRELPTGYIRHTTADESRMLDMMEKDHAVNSMYVLDMYRHGKVYWLLDSPLRAVLLLILFAVYMFIEKKIKKIVAHDKGNETDTEIKRTEMKKSTGMEKFSLRENEEIIGRLDMYYWYMRMNGSFYVTNQRLCYKDNIFDHLYMDFSISEIAGYDTGRMLFTPYIRIYDIYKSHGNEYKFSALSIKKLCRWLEQAGVNKMVWGNF